MAKSKKATKQAARKDVTRVKGAKKAWLIIGSDEYRRASAIKAATKREAARAKVRAAFHAGKRLHYSQRKAA